MANWKTYMNSDYSGCRLLAYARDQYRGRDVRLYLIPGEWEAVGVTDGTDRWIAPVRADVFSVNVERLLADIKAGKEIPKPTPLVRRERVKLEPQEPAKRARVALEEPQPKRSARVQLI